MKEEKVVHFRSQSLHATELPNLEGAFQAFMPQSKDFMSSDTELWNFLCSLRQDFSPVILRSKDVYGYASCRAVVPDPEQVRASSSTASTNVPAKRKRGSRRGAGKKRRRSARRGGSDELETSSNTSSGGSSGRSSPPVAPPLPAYSHFGKSLEEIWKAATPRAPNSFPCIRVEGVSQADELAAARRQAQDVLQLNLEPVVLVRRFPLP